jgi:predicted nuclease of predicted toxin-antitoxin system
LTLKLMMDVHVRRAVTSGLRRKGVDVLTAQEDGSNRVDDPDLMNRATQLDRILFSQDHDLLREAARRQQCGEEFSGLVYVHQEKLTTGQIIRDLEIIAKIYEPDDMRNRVEYLPL